MVRGWLLVVCSLTLLGELIAIITLVLEYRYQLATNIIIQGRLFGIGEHIIVNPLTL
jgi:hypothetical protein